MRKKGKRAAKIVQAAILVVILVFGIVSQVSAEKPKDPPPLPQGFTWGG